jgi:hypothetical protein
MPLQNHIHISTTLQTTGEKAPDLKWVITDRLEIPLIFMSLRRALTGKLRKHRLTNQNGIVQFSNLKYTLKVQSDFGYTLQERMAQLKAMNGEDVYLCDSFHAADGQDHSLDVRRMVLSRVGEFPPVGPGLQYFLVDVELESDEL